MSEQVMTAVHEVTRTLENRNNPRDWNKISSGTGNQGIITDYRYFVHVSVYE